jgi:hypothetical protein
MYAYCGNNPVSRSDDSGYIWNYVIGASVGVIIATVTTAVDAVNATNGDVIAAFTSGKTWAKMGVSAICGAINGAVAASGAHTTLGGIVGSATGFIESLSHELIDNGKMSSESWAEVKSDAMAGFLGGLSGGSGAVYGNKYMSQQGSRFLKHIATDGLKKASSFYTKMTANYSKQFVKSTLSGLAKGWIGGKVANQFV